MRAFGIATPRDGSGSVGGVMGSVMGVAALSPNWRLRRDGDPSPDSAPAAPAARRLDRRLSQAPG